MEASDLTKLPKKALAKKVLELTSRLSAYETEKRPIELLRLQELFSLTPRLAELLHLLSDGQPHTRDLIMRNLYADRHGDAPEIKIVDVMVSKLRKQVNQYGVEFDSIWGRGYRLSAGLEVVIAVCAGRRPDLVDRIPERRIPTRAGQAPTGAAVATVKAELGRRADKGGRVEFEAREFASHVRLKRNLSTVLEHLERNEKIRVEERPGKHTHGERRWVVVLAQGYSRGFR